LRWWSPGADSAAQSARKGLRGRRENTARRGKRDELEITARSQRQSCAAMPETAGGEFVMNRFGGLVTWAVGGASISREAQRMLVYCSGKIAGVVGEAGQARRVQGRYRDLQQQSDRGKRSAETPARSRRSSALRTGDGQPSETGEWRGGSVQGNVAR